MIIQVLLTLSCLFFVFYGLGQFQHSRLGGYTIVILVSSCTWFIWNPNDSTIVANLFGIGRGADFLLYLWFVVSAALIFILHIKLARQSRQITELARYIAILECNNPSNLKSEINNDH
jgi:hypothetical protein